MSMTDQLKRISTVIKGGAAVLALLPGVATLIGLVEIPPNVGNLVTFISIFVGMTCLLAGALLSDLIKNTNGQMVAIIVGLLTVLGATAATTYYLFAKDHIVSINDTGRSRVFVSSVRPSARVVQIVRPYEYDYVEALEASSQRFELMDMMDRESGITILILVALLIIAQAASISAVVIGAWKLTS